MKTTEATTTPKAFFFAVCYFRQAHGGIEIPSVGFTVGIQGGVYTLFLCNDVPRDVTKEFFALARVHIVNINPQRATRRRRWTGRLPLHTARIRLISQILMRLQVQYENRIALTPK